MPKVGSINKRRGKHWRSANILPDGTHKRFAASLVMAIRGVTTTWPHSFKATLTSAATFLTVLVLSFQAFQLLHPSHPPLIDDTNLSQGLAKSNTPIPGHESSILGYGDADGGRPIIVYLGQEETVPVRPVINAFVDVSKEEPDERQFLRVSRLVALKYSSGDKLDYQRHVTVTPGNPGVGILVRMDNDSQPPKDCGTLKGGSVATNVHLRLAIWDTPNRDQHVVRAWVTTDNSAPIWITDAVLIDSAPNMRLSLVAASAHRKLPAIASEPLADAAGLFKSGGVEVADGLLGGCWDNRLAVFVVLQVSPV